MKLLIWRWFVICKDHGALVVTPITAYIIIYRCKKSWCFYMDVHPPHSFLADLVTWLPGSMPQIASLNSILNSQFFFMKRDEPSQHDNHHILAVPWLSSWKRDPIPLGIERPKGKKWKDKLRC
jgi:hypothetical protein